MNRLIKEVKANRQDYEFYPTTDEIINAMLRDVKRTGGNQYRYDLSSFLDIGAGNGKVLAAVKKELDLETYAIEKSDMLRGLLAQSVYIIGTDFLEQSLIDKDINITFCNPPYSEYIEWTKKILRESASKYVYLVIPTRWKESEEIAEAIKYRDAKYKTVGKYTFEHAEDRAARAVVNLIRFELAEETEDAFDRFFKSEFKDLLNKFPDGEDDKPKEEDDESKFKSLVVGENYVKTLVSMYNEDIKNIGRNYELVGKLDAGLLREFDVTPVKVLKCLKEKRKGLKNIYWNELINRMKEITNRLITKKRTQLLGKLHKNGSVDFTESNVYAVVLWILKNAGDYIDEQVISVYERFITAANCRNYKSNHKVYEKDEWRYNQEKPTHVFLDYRIVLHSWGAIERRFLRSDKYQLGETSCEYIRDLLTIAQNLGFERLHDYGDDRLNRWNDQSWEPGKPQTWSGHYKGDFITIFEVKAHLNGNLHIRLNQKLALALNVEYGRLKGWIHSGDQAVDEIQDKDAAQYFKSNFTMLKSPFLAIEQKIEEKEGTETENAEQVELSLT